MFMSQQPQPQPQQPDGQERLARMALYLGVNTNPAVFHRVLLRAGSALEAFAGTDLTPLGVNLKPLLRSGLFEEAQSHLEYGRAEGWRLMIWGDADYSERLLEIPDPPPVLWIKGTFEPRDKLAVSLVGSRRASQPGLLMARSLGRQGASMGLAIVSGLAKGIDAQVHRGALEAGGRTLGVMGCGLDWVYPKENADLYEEIALQGAVISEFLPATRPMPVNFPRRNRVIAGLSLAVVVVEAGVHSGALITARLGLEFNREVLALPGPVGSPFARGTNGLIKSGAGLVENMKEVVSEIKPRLLEGLTPHHNPPQLEALYEGDFPEPDITPVPPRRRTTKKAAPVANAEPQTVAQAPAIPAVVVPRPEPNTPEGKILASLAGGPMDADSLIRATGLGVAEMGSLLLNMELEGLATRLTSGQYKL